MITHTLLNASSATWPLITQSAQSAQVTFLLKTPVIYVCKATSAQYAMHALQLSMTTFSVLLINYAYTANRQLCQQIVRVLAAKISFWFWM